jgi:hypothetical protein
MSRLDLIVGYLLAQMSPDPIDMYEFTTVKRDPDYDRFNWQDVGTQSSELLLALIEGYPHEFLKDHRQVTLKNIVGSYIGAQIAAFDRHVDQQVWSQQNVSGILRYGADKSPPMRRTIPNTPRKH